MQRDVYGRPTPNVWRHSRSGGRRTDRQSARSVNRPYRHRLLAHDGARVLLERDPLLENAQGTPCAFSSTSSATTRRKSPSPSDRIDTNSLPGRIAELNRPSRGIFGPNRGFNRSDSCVNAECRTHIAPSAAASLRERKIRLPRLRVLVTAETVPFTDRLPNAHL